MSLSLEVVKKLVPRGQRTLITQEFIDKIENCMGDSLIADQFKDNFVSYLNILGDSKYKMEDYISAVKYVSFKLLGYTNIDAYAATFPDRYQRLKLMDQKQIDAYVSMYNKGKLVVQMYEQSLVPSYVLNAPMYQDALNTLAEMIIDPSVKGMAKVKACEAILQHTKQPEIIKTELTIGTSNNDSLNDLREVTEKLAETYRAALVGGQVSLKEIAESKLIDVTPKEVE